MVQRGAPRRSTHLEKRKNMVDKPFFKRGPVQGFIILAMASLSLVVVANPSAQAASGDPAFEMYLDAPFVENSYVYTDHKDEADPQVALSNFDQSSNFIPCEVTGATVTLLTPTNGCWTWDEPTYGGAFTEGSDPAVGNLAPEESPARLRYGQASGFQGVRLEYSTPQHYFGMWWSAGSVGNVITFYSDGRVVAQTTANEVESIISSQQSIASTSGSTYDSSLYLGNPVTWSTHGNPVDFSQQDPDNNYVHGDLSYDAENFVYLHFFSQGSVTYDRVELSAPGNGFEFDNIVTSSRADLTPLDRLVHVKTVNQPTLISFDANGGQGNLPNQTSTDSLPWDCPDYSGTASSNCMIRPPGEFGDRSNPFYFDGWNTSPDGSGARFDAGNVADVQGDTILYAQWRAHFYLDPSPPGQEWLYQDVYTQPTSSFTLPNESELSGENTNPGFHIDHWVYRDYNWNDVTLGSPGQSISPDDIVTFLQSDYLLRAVWVEGDRPSGQPAPSAVVTTVVPVDPRATSATLPPMPLSDAASASVCIDEVDSSHATTTSNLSFSAAPDTATNRTPGFTVSAPSPLVPSAPRYLRYRIAVDGDTSCGTSNDYFIELRPLNLSDRRSSDADLTRR